MSRITPATGTIVDLEDDEPYRVHLVGQPVLVDSKAEYGGAKRLELTWRLSEGDPEDTLKDWMGLKLGQNSAGEVSKLRMLLNALAGKPKETPIAWFDDETFEWSYDERAFSKLTEGFEVVIRGENKLKADGQERRFNIEKYQPVSKAAAAAPPPPPVDQYQVSPDGKFRWKAGMAGWELIPTAPAPPPPPPPSAPAASSTGTSRRGRGSSSTAEAPPAAPPPPPADGAETEPPF